jgi:hypothetical protein
MDSINILMTEEKTVTSDVIEFGGIAVILPG